MKLTTFLILGFLSLSVVSKAASNVHANQPDLPPECSELRVN